MKIQVVGPGCAKCKKLYAETEKALAQAGVSAELTKVETIDGMLACGVGSTPSLLIDGVVKSAGNVPDAAKIAAWIEEVERKH